MCTVYTHWYSMAGSVIGEFHWTIWINTNSTKVCSTDDDDGGDVFKRYTGVTYYVVELCNRFRNATRVQCVSVAVRIRFLRCIVVRRTRVWYVRDFNRVFTTYPILNTSTGLFFFFKLSITSIDDPSTIVDNRSNKNYEKRDSYLKSLEHEKRNKIIIIIIKT